MRTRGARALIDSPAVECSAGAKRLSVVPLWGALWPPLMAQLWGAPVFVTFLLKTGENLHYYRQ